MKNLHILKDNIYSVDILNKLADGNINNKIVSCSVDLSMDRIFMCDNKGYIYLLDNSNDEMHLQHSKYHFNMVVDEDIEDIQNDNKWFDIQVLSEVSQIVGISHSGCIVTISVNQNFSDSSEMEMDISDVNMMSLAKPVHEYTLISCEGNVEGGIASAAWSPDQRFLLIVTNNDTLICMTNTWEVVNEIDLEPRASLEDLDAKSVCSMCDVTWRGDSEYFSIYSVDASDKMGKVRTYTKDLEFVGVSHDVGGGGSAGSGAKGGLNSIIKHYNDKKTDILMQGLISPVMSFASPATSGGGLIATPRRSARTGNKLQIVFVETNGLHHGDFDVCIPQLDSKHTEALKPSSWVVEQLQWHPVDATLMLLLTHPDSDACVFQVYHRNNYYWYLKQQINGLNLKFLGLDSERLGRIYLSVDTPVLSEDNKYTVTHGFRILDVQWEIDCSLTAPDDTCVVVDGAELMCSPIGIVSIPPPMCSFRIKPSSQPIRSTHFVPISRVCNGVESNQWAVLSLCCDNGIAMTVGNCDNRGKPICSVQITPPISPSLVDFSGSDMDVSSIIRYLHYSGITYRRIVGIVASDSQNKSDETDESVQLRICLLGSISKPFDSHSIEMDREMLLVLNIVCKIPYSQPVSSKTIPEPLPTIEVKVCSEQLVSLPGTVSFMNATRVVDDRQYIILGLNIDEANSMPFGTDLDSNVGMTEDMNNTTVAHHVYIFNKSGQMQVNPDKCIEFVGKLTEECYDVTIIQSDPKGVLTCQVQNNTNGTVLNSDERKANENNGLVLIGLSRTGRLYCGENVICASCSSYIVNHPLSILLYISNLTQPPLLHFLSFTALYVLNDPLMEDFGSSKAYQWLGLTTNEAMIDTTPRPVERGARLIASVPNDTRVIIQLPRGNLELFDPRPLVLLYAKKLLHEGRYFACLHLLRKQRIDMNILYDSNPMGFMKHIESMILDTIAFSYSNSNSRSSSGGASSNSSGSLELLSLFISSLENNLNSESKYALPSGSVMVDLSTDTNSTETEVNHEVKEATEYVKTLATVGDKQHISAVGPVEEVAVCTKVNDICVAFKNIMLPLVDRKVRDDDDAVLKHVTLASLINPLLLTYAKQSPPLLVDAMSVIRQISHKKLSLTQSQPVTEQQIISSPLIISSIKYLAFVVQLDLLFNAALGECDFEFAMAVARQGQMDPKVYLPLIQSFQALCPTDKYPVKDTSVETELKSGPESGFDIDYSPEYLYMRTRVFLHLGNERKLDAIEWGFKCLLSHFKSYLNTKGTVDPILAKILSLKKNKSKSNAMDGISTPDVNTSDVNTIVPADYIQLGMDLISLIELVEITKCEVFYEKSFVLCHELNNLLNANKKTYNLIIDKQLMSLPNDMLRRLKMAYGKCCIKWNRYEEAVALYLSTEPVAAAEAIDACRMNNQYDAALLIANRYAKLLDGLKDSPDGSENDTDYSVSALAQDMIYEFKENLEINNSESNSMLFTNTSSAISKLIHQNKKSEQSNKNNDKELRAEEECFVIARMCIEYNNKDVESAVQILLASKKWVEACHMAIKYQRMDIFQDEIATCVRGLAKVCVNELKEACSRYKTIVTELNTVFWKDTAVRYSQVCEKDTILKDLVDKISNSNTEQEDANDNASEFSAVSQFSLASNISLSSYKSRNSTTSLNSLGSVHSIQSKGNKSTTSMLSKLSSMSTNATPTHVVDSKGAFSIIGLEHSLLSRGDSKDRSKKKSKKEKYLDEDNVKQKKKRERREGRNGKDEMNTKREGQICDELAVMADITNIGIILKNLSDALLLLNTLKDKQLIHELYVVMDEYISTIQGLIPKIAPEYPYEWLDKRTLTSIVLFQEVKNDENEIVEVSCAANNWKYIPVKAPVVETWWEHAIRGVEFWVSISKKYKNV